MTSSRRGRRSGDDRERPFQDNDPDAQRRRAVVTLAVTPQEAEKLLLAANEGKLDIALRNPEDQAIVETEGAMQELPQELQEQQEASVAVDARLRVQRRTRRKPASPARRQARAAKPAEVPGGPSIRISR
jgi:Flp pilus assembly protein CpaB